MKEVNRVADPRAPASMNCPKCGADDWKPVSQQHVSQFKACGNCNYAPALEHATVMDAKTWVESIATEHAERQQEAHDQEQQLHDIEKPTTLQHGRLAKAKRLLAVADKKMHIAEALSEVVGATESGQITLLIPELGLYQFEWGEFNLFKAIAKVQKDVKPV